MTDSMGYYCDPSRAVPVLHMHGTNDNIVAYGTGGPGSVQWSLDWWLQHNGCPTTPVITQLPDVDPTDNCTAEFQYFGPCNNGTEVEHYRIESGGHTWPGSGDNFFGVGGNVNMDIDGSRIIWDFFNRHSLEGALPVSTPQHRAPQLVSVHPNPTIGPLQVRANGSQVEGVRLLDATGRLMERNYSGTKEAIVLKAPKTFCPFLMQVSVTDLTTA